MKELISKEKNQSEEDLSIIEKKKENLTTKSNLEIKNVFEEKSIITPDSNNFQTVLNNWTKILETIKPLSHSIHACLKSCAPAGIVGDTFYIKTNYSFHKKRLNENKNKLTIIKIVDKLTQCKFKIEVITENQIEELGINISSSNGEDVLNDALQMMGGRIIK